MVKANKQVIIDCIVLHVEQGKSFMSSLELITTNWILHRSTFNRYWKVANELHTEAQGLIKEAKGRVDIGIAIGEREGQLADALERKLMLSNVARGKVSLDKPVVVNGQVKYVAVVSSFSERIAAINELNRMEGEHAATKVANTDTAGNDIEPSFIQWGNKKIILRG